jgi:hypothetical protein
MRHRIAFPPLALAAVLLTTSAAAQLSTRPPRPYAAVEITLPEPLNDPSLAALRAAILTAAKTRIYGELAALVVSGGFFIDRDFKQRFNARAPGVDNLAAAVDLEKNQGAGWNRLAAFASEDTAAPLESRFGVVCSPGQPRFDAVEFSRLLEKTVTSEVDWVYPRAGETIVRSTPQANAAAIAKINLHFVRVLAAPETNPSRQSDRSQWFRVLMPDGKVGFTMPDSLRFLSVERLCYSNDPIVGWRISGFVANDKDDVR